MNTNTINPVPALDPRVKPPAGWHVRLVLNAGSSPRIHTRMGVVFGSHGSTEEVQASLAAMFDRVDTQGYYAPRAGTVRLHVNHVNDSTTFVLYPQNGPALTLWPDNDDQLNMGPEWFAGAFDWFFADVKHHGLTKEQRAARGL